MVSTEKKSNMSQNICSKFGKTWVKIRWPNIIRHGKSQHGIESSHLKDIYIKTGLEPSGELSYVEVCQTSSKF